MIDNEIYQKYTFLYKDAESSINFELNETDDNCLTWPQILNKFIKFLEMTHNYEIMHKVKLKYSPFIDPETDWQGKFFDVPEDKDEDDRQMELFPETKAGLTE